jgi:hypothetical protein
MDDPSWSYRTTLPAEPVSAPRARAFVCRHLIEHGLAYLVDPVRLVVSELATHTMVHARGAFTITLSRIDRAVVLTVREELSEVRLPTQRQAPDLAGRGLRIVEIISSDWGVTPDRSGGPTVWASFDLRAPQAV